MDWLFGNKEWIFSGVGVALLGGLLAWFLRRTAPRQIYQEQIAGTDSYNVQAGRNFDVKTKVPAREPKSETPEAQSQEAGDRSINIQAGGDIGMEAE